MMPRNLTVSHACCLFQIASLFVLLDLHIQDQVLFDRPPFSYWYVERLQWQHSARLLKTTLFFSCSTVFEFQR